MGSFLGHAIPGTFLMLQGIWWLLLTYRRYIRSVRKDGAPFTSAVSFGVTVPPFGLRLDGLVVTIMGVTGMMLEFFVAPAISHSPSHTMGMNNLQHGTMYIFFAMAGLMILLTSRMTSSLLFTEDLQYVTAILALTVEGLLFNFHLYERSPVDVLLHQLLLYTVYAAVISLLLEMKYRDNIIVAQCKAASLILQGTWFWQIGFYLYNPFQGNSWTGPYDRSSDENRLSYEEEIQQMMHPMMFMACSFAWHVAAVFVSVLVTGIVMAKMTQRWPTAEPLIKKYADDTASEED